MPTFRVRGPLDVTTAATTRADLTTLLGAPGTDDLVIDLLHVGAVDPVGLGLLVGMHRQAQRVGRRLVLAQVPPRVMRMLTITRLSRVITITESVRADSVRIDDELRIADGRDSDDASATIGAELALDLPMEPVAAAVAAKAARAG
ncbi:MAG TPA: STAS domain-containing protein [Acidothermaceae bacterium]|jgi:anti-anti-sigma factor